MSVLPAAQQAGRIAEKVQENPITLITGDTGCGKSTQVPRILLESMRGRILCTQPRRLAVMGVASRVAEELGETLGGDIVGYHVGNQRAGDDGTRLMFATAGVVLEILKKEGLRVLARYSAIIVDEVHERSVENDLLLACIRRLLPKAGEQRLVLMSATADVMRLRTFFSSLEVVALAASSAIWNTRELYLRQALEFATSHLRERDAKDSAAADEKLRRQVEALAHEPQELSLLQPLITRLVLQLLLKMHKGEAEAPKRGGGDEESSGRTVLVFLPTYATLESQYDSLHRTLPLGTPLHLLHSSVDLEGALAEMSADAPTAPRVVLASSVAESSVTIEGVAHVIDSCRANEVYFSGATQATNARLVWVSVSQADQRRGRTGRTCHGSCWRLLPRSFFKLELELYEQPAVQLLPLRKECLALSCADDPRIADAPAVFQATIDPPAPRNVEAAFRKLEQMGAVHEEALPVPRRQRKQLGAVAGASRFVPTTLGTICDAMPVDLESSLFVLHCLRAHLLPEAVLLASLNCTTPLVLVRRPLELEQYERLVERFGPGATRVARGLAPQDVDLLANLAAYHCHRRLLLDPQRWRRAGMLYAADESGGGGVQLEAEFEELDEVEAEEEGWFCDAEQLSRTSLHAVARTAEQVLCALCERNPPLLNRALEYSEREISPVVGGGDELFAKLVPLQVVRRVAPLLAFLRPDGALAADKVSPTAELSRQDATMSALAAAIGGGAPAAAAASGVTPPSRSFKPKQVACSFFLRGACNRGGDCPFAHTFGAERPICKYAQAGTCKFGARCMYRHPELECKPVEGEPTGGEARDEAGDGDALGDGTAGEIPSRILPLRESDLGLAEKQARRSTGRRELGPTVQQWMRRAGGGNIMLLLGAEDDDFAAAAALATALAASHDAASATLPPGYAAPPAGRVIAASARSREAVLGAHAGAEANLVALAASGGIALFGVQPMRLHAAHAAMEAAVAAHPPALLVWDVSVLHGVGALKQQLVARFFTSAMLRMVYAAAGTLLSTEVQLNLSTRQLGPPAATLN